MRNMDEWMDRWMHSRISGWMGIEKMDGIDGCIDEWISRQMDGMNGQMHGQMVEWMDSWISGWMGMEKQISKRCGKERQKK